MGDHFGHECQHCTFHSVSYAEGWQYLQSLPPLLDDPGHPTVSYVGTIVIKTTRHGLLKLYFKID